MGWDRDRLTKLTQIVEHGIEPTSGGLIHTYAIDTTAKRRDTKGRRFKETVESNFLLRAVGDHTSAEELKRHLDLAEFLGLFDKQSREAFVSGLARQFPGGFGEVKISNIARYDNAALRDACGSVSGEGLRELARQTMRRLVGAKYTGMRHADWLARVGFAYLSPSLHEVFEKECVTPLA